MLNKNEMLTYIAQNAEMGCCGIANIKNYAKDDGLKKALRIQLIEYGKIYSNANNMLRNSNENVQRVNPIVRRMTKQVTKRHMERDNSDSHIAQMMINGNIKGVSKIVDRMRQYDKSDPKVENLAKKLLETEYNNIQSMTPFI